MKKSIGNYQGEDLFLVIGKYRNNDRIYLGLETYDEEPYADITINLSDYLIPDDNYIFLSGDLNFELKNFLIDKDIIDVPFQKMQYNMGRYDFTTVNIEKLKEYDMEGYQEFTSNFNEMEM